MSISNTFPLKCVLCILLEDGKWDVNRQKCFMGSWLLFISCINYIQQWDLMKYIYNLLKTLLETIQTLLSPGVLSQAWLGWQSAELSPHTKAKLTLVKRNCLPGWRLFLISLSIVERWRTGNPAMRWVKICIRLSKNIQSVIKPINIMPGDEDIPI